MLETLPRQSAIEQTVQGCKNLIYNVLIDYWIQEYQQSLEDYNDLPEEADSDTVSQYLKDIACAKQAVKNCLDRLYYINNC